MNRQAFQVVVELVLKMAFLAAAIYVICKVLA
jgi:hypothetical protein